MCADKGTGLHQTLEEADGHDRLWLMHRGSYHGETSPDHHHQREEYPRPHIVQRQVRRDLPNNIAHSEAGVDFIVLVADKAQLLFHTRNISIGEIRAVKLSRCVNIGIAVGDLARVRGVSFDG